METSSGGDRLKNDPVHMKQCLRTTITRFSHESQFGEALTLVRWVTFKCFICSCSGHSFECVPGKGWQAPPDETLEGPARAGSKFGSQGVLDGAGIAPLLRELLLQHHVVLECLCSHFFTVRPSSVTPEHRLRGTTGGCPLRVALSGQVSHLKALLGSRLQDGLSHRQARSLPLAP